MEPLAKDRMMAIIECHFADNNKMPVPTQPDATTFYWQNEVYLALSLYESDISCRVVADNNMIKFWRSVWQYMGQFHGGMIVYKLKPFASYIK
jgi:hypothetical protein